MKWSVYACAVLAAMVLGALAADPVAAQITTCTVAGSVKDDQGLAVPGARPISPLLRQGWRVLRELAGRATFHHGLLEI